MGSGNTPQDGKAIGERGQSDTSAKASAREPGWADGLRKLYDSVVDEPLPDNFKDLLARLDDEPEGGKR